jgi:hypothetical protein
MTKKSENWYKKGKTIISHDIMMKKLLGEKKYKYVLTENIGENIDLEFKFAFTPKQMLEMGVFEGKYMNDMKNEFPKEWYENARICQRADSSYNYFGIKSRQSLKVWMKNGWVPVKKNDMDIRGWFQWFCRYYIGRRIPEIDKIQISRWKKIKRHYAQVQKNCEKNDLKCRPKQRQSLLQWSWDCFV